MEEAQVTARVYFGMNGTPIHRYWASNTEPVWRHGYIRLYFGAGVYLRDARPLDPTGDPTTIPEDASGAGDQRVSTHVHVILESEIDRSNTNLRGPDQPWTEEAVWLERINDLLGDTE